MTKKNTNTQDRIIAVVKNDKPETVAKLISIMKKRYSLPEHEIITHVIKLQRSGNINLQESLNPTL